MHYVKQFNINGVDTKQVACIELQGKPNAATEGCVGVLGIDVTSPTHDVYKCVAVNGGIYTWEFLSSGMSIITATKTGEGFLNKTFEYSDLRYPEGYIVRRGDLILDCGGYLYQVNAIGNASCDTTYTGIVFGVGRDVPGVAPAIRTINNALLRFFVGTLEEYSTLNDAEKQNLFAIITDDKAKEEIEGAIKALQAEVAMKEYTVQVVKEGMFPEAQLTFPIEKGRVYFVNPYYDGIPGETSTVYVSDIGNVFMSSDGLVVMGVEDGKHRMLINYKDVDITHAIIRVI